MNPKQNSIQKDLKAIFWPSLLLAIFLSALLGYAIWSIPGIHESYRTGVASSLPVLIQSTDITFIYGGWIFLLGVILLLINACYASVIGRTDSALSLSISKPLQYIAIVGFAGIFLGRYVGNAYWADYLSNHHYSVCQNTFAMTGKWGIRV